MIPTKFESRFSTFALIYHAVLAALVSFLVAMLIGGTLYGHQIFASIASFLVIITAYLLVRRIICSKALEKRSLALEAMAVANGWKFQKQPHSYEVTRHYFPSITKLPRAKNQIFRNYIQTPNWSLVDFEYDLHQDIKGWEYKSSTVYYSIMFTELPRQLPHMMFDSSKSRKHQLEVVYSKEQKHSLEGNFDEFFETYFIEDYIIDSMSIISPEVMQSMIGAHEYDIEIERNHVAIFGSILNAKDQVTEMESKLSAIRKTLMNNIVTYRDERLPYKEGRAGVAPLGASLKRRKKSIVLGIIFCAIYLLLYAAKGFGSL